VLKRLSYLASAFIVMGGLFVSTVPAFATPVITEFHDPLDQYGSYGITSGQDGALWFSHLYPNTIGRITTAGVMTEYQIPTPNAAPYGITTGPDGNIWFAELGGNKIGRITTAGVITEFPVPTAASDPYYITPGPDGNLWFTEGTGNHIGRITTSGVITEFTVPTSNSYPFGIVAGPDGNLWFTESFGNNVGRITTSGVITEYPTGGNYLYGITVGSDGALWFVDTFGTSIKRITTSGVVDTSFGIPGPASEPYNITAGPDGNLWFTDQSGIIGSMSLSGVFTKYTTPSAQLATWGITAGPDGNIWFTEIYGNNIGRLQLSVATDTTPPVLGMPTWSSNPKPTTGTTTLTVPATENLSGISRAEYFVGDTDPGQGNGTSMTLANTQTSSGGEIVAADLAASFGSNFQPGVYKVTVRAQDLAGNWSSTTSDYMVVFDPSGPTDVAASKKVIPLLANGDALPGLLSDTQNDKADLGFDVLLAANGTVDPTSKLSLDYATGQACNSPHPTNCHTTNFTVNTTTPNIFNWLTVGGTNESIGTFQGQGTLTIDGTVTTNPFRVVATDGNRTTPASSDDVLLQIFAPRANPDTAVALYQLHIRAAGNWAKIQ
jgi:virginiamycin B lyase